MKKYIKSLFPFRWIFIVLFILAFSILITCGFAAKKYDGDIIYFNNKLLWYGGNIVFWFIIDILFGLGQEGYFLKIK